MVLDPRGGSRLGIVLRGQGLGGESGGLGMSVRGQGAWFHIGEEDQGWQLFTEGRSTSQVEV